MQNIKNIIFDYGNVIFTINFRKAQAAFKELGIADPDAFFGHRQQDQIFDKFDRGEVTENEFTAYVREKIGNEAITDQQITDAWNSLLIGIAPGSHEILLKLKSKYRTFLLSNINAIHYTYIMNYLKTDFGFDDNEHLFEKTYYSHLIGKRKPQPDIFEQVLQENNLKPEETLFIDDSPQHLEAAAKLGIQTYLMTAPDTLAKFVEREHLA
ncbi:HAD family phosphatase [Mucilaginibacter pallidiroseus]|uniref:HAD family phosphatase n=1 Tax=Mucilaginibacter pallidiroseus TaxID=2599295 RepID=A0A563U0H8_9SPHI|nr:HAD family phosphatase [Mucilaginibacter pallidiroseus]TWR25126.1 HAD family phosphatase [Mucilaginibacter pallidiroseus]